MKGSGARRFLSFARFARTEEAGSASEARGSRAVSVCVASGKGGTGKSIVSASLAHALAQRGRTLIVDADMGIGNAHILQGVCPERSFVEVVVGGLSVLEIVTPCGPALDLLAAGSGVSHMAGLAPEELRRIAEGIELIEPSYAHVLVDSAAGVSEQTIAFAASSDLVLLVTTPDVTAMTDAYAFAKVLLRVAPSAHPLLVVNRARGAPEAEAVAARMESVSLKFLGRAPRWIGWVPDDPAVCEAVNARAPVVVHRPRSAAARALEGIAESVIEALELAPGRGLGAALLRRNARSRRSSEERIALARRVRARRRARRAN